MSGRLLRGAAGGALLALLLAACAGAPPRDTREGDVDMDAVEPEGAGRLSLEAGQRFIMGAARPGDRHLPVYPASRLAEGLGPVALCVEVESDPDGAVTAVRRLTTAAGCAPVPGFDDEAFFEAVVAAVSRWRYEQSWLCADDGRDPDPPRAHCGDMPGTPIPLLRGYRFTFSQRDGQASVGVDEAGR